MARKELLALYSPLPVILLSFVFTPIFGAYLQAQNWDTLRDLPAARRSRQWIRTCIWLVILYIGMQVVFVDEPLMRYAGIYFALVMWVVWFVSSGRHQWKAIKALDPSKWEKKPLGRPLVVAGLFWVLYVMTTVSIGLAMSLFGFSSPVTPSQPDAVIIKRDPASGKSTVEPTTPTPANELPSGSTRP